MSADLLARLITAGTPASLVAEVAMAIAQAEAQAKVDTAALERRRQADADRQQARRDRKRVAAGAGDRDVTVHHVTSRDGADEPAPSPSPLSSPQTPQQTPHPHPHPEGYHVHARGLLARIVLAVIIDGCRAAGEGAAPAGKRRWPRDMPPPAGVTADQWAGFIDHRKAKRNSLTPRAYQLLLAKLDEHASDEWPPGRIVDLIVERGWLTFEPSWILNSTGPRNAQRPHHERPSGAVESRRRFREQFELEPAGGDADG
jgi:hypothetical protein